MPRRKLPFGLSYLFPTFSTPSSSSSNPESLMLLESELKTAKLVKGAKKAFIMGTNYKLTDDKLDACVNDCKRIDASFKSLGYTTHAFYSEYTLECTRVITEITNWFSSLKAGDNAIFYYSGHGSHVPDDKKKKKLSQPSDPNKNESNSSNNSEPDGQDEALYFGPTCFIIDDFLRKCLQRLSPEVKILLIFDCCESGSMVDLPFRYQGLTKYVDSKHKFAANVISISGCHDGKVSYESNGSGFLTSSLIKTIRTLKRKTRLGLGNSTVKTWLDFYLKLRENIPELDPNTNSEPQELQLSYAKEEEMENFWL